MKTSYKLKEHTLASALLKGTDLRISDAARLVLEATENLGDKAKTASRTELVQLLRRVIRSGAESVLQSEHSTTLEQAAWASVEARQSLRPSSRRDLRHFVRRILRVEGAGQLILRSITSNQCRHILSSAFGKSRSSYIKGRVILHSIFSYGIKQEWADSNPVDRIETPTVQEKNITPLQPEEVSKLRNTCKEKRHRAMQFSLHLMLYCGIRPAEVQRLKRDDIIWEEQLIIIRPQTSKTGGGRAVPLRGAEHLNPNECIIPKNWQRRWHRLRQDAGFTHWTADICRHTFASYHAARYRDIAKLQLEMGHRDSNLLRTRYMTPVLKRETERFWALCNEASNA